MRWNRRFVVDSLRGDADGLMLHLTLGRNAFGRDSAMVVAGPGAWESFVT